MNRPEFSEPRYQRIEPGPAEEPVQGTTETNFAGSGAGNPVCPVCGAVTIDIRGKAQCPRCHTICETCCEGGRL